MINSLGVLTNIAMCLRIFNGNKMVMEINIDCIWKKSHIPFCIDCKIFVSFVASRMLLFKMDISLFRHRLRKLGT